MPFRFVDESVDLQSRGRLIEVDDHGEVVGVRMNNRSMVPLDLPADELDVFYAAYRAFAAVLAEPSATVEFTLQPGELVAFDNRRVMHGRSTYSPQRRRLLQGCYIDIDTVRSAVLVHDTTLT